MDAPVQYPKHKLCSEAADPIADRELVRRGANRLRPLVAGDADRQFVGKVELGQLVELMRP
jgi:hypothetical protein